MAGLLVDLATFLLGLLPRAVALKLGAALGALAYVLGIRRRVALDNLAIAFPEKGEAERRAIAYKAYKSLGASLFESLRAPHLTDADLQALLEYENWERYQSALAQGQGVVVASAHLGNWELLASGLARLGVPLNAVTRPLKGAVNARIVQARVRAGLREISPKGAVQAGLERLRLGEVVAVLLDQNMPLSRGIFVEYFGKLASTAPSAGLLATRSQAPVIVVLALNTPEGKVRICVEGPFAVPRSGNPDADVHQLTQDLTRCIEGFVRRYPEQWLWLHRRWKVRPPGEKVEGATTLAGGL